MEKKRRREEDETLMFRREDDGAGDRPELRVQLGGRKAKSVRRE